jgi:hypothetical protein
MTRRLEHRKNYPMPQPATTTRRLPKDGGRWRRYRERERAGLAVLPVKAHFNRWSGALVDGGFLSEQDCDDTSKVIAATERVIELLQTRLSERISFET